MVTEVFRRPLEIELVGYGPLDGLRIRIGKGGFPPGWEFLEPGEKPVAEKRLLVFRPTGRVHQGRAVYEFDEKSSK